MKVFREDSVLEAARKRVALVFDNFQHITVSVSGGKDSTVLYHLTMREAERRNRKVTVFFLDQEAEYAATIDVIEGMMRHPLAIPQWYQVPVRMTNATSLTTDFLYAWGEGQEWMRPKSPLAIHRIEDQYPDRFYDFFKWKEKNTPDTAFLIGLRAEESLNRFRSVTKNPGWKVRWSTKTENPTSFRFYPVYDWSLSDVWKFIDDEGVQYNRIYDKMFAANHNYYNTMRVSNLIHEKSFSCLTSLQELEPETYDALIRRLPGPHVAALYAREDLMFAAKALPAAFKTWKEYRDYLLESSPLKHREKFRKRFAGQEDSEDVHRQQVKQLMINDHENSVAPLQKKAEKRKKDLAEWWDLL